MSAETSSAPSAVIVIARIALMRMFRGRAIWISVALLLIPVLIAAAFGGKPTLAAEAWLASVGVTTLQALFLFIPALHCAGVVADELDDRTYTYLFTRPAPRWTLLAGKLLAIYAVLAVGFALSLAASHTLSLRSVSGMAMGRDVTRVLGRVLAGGLLGVLASCCLAVSAGAIFPKRPFATVFAYLLVVEMAIGSLPSVISRVSIAFHVRMIAFGGIPGQRGDSTLRGSVLAIFELSAIFLAVAFWRLSRAEYRSEQ